MDIRYGYGGSYGGSKYVLVLVDQCTTNPFVYGMQGSSGADVCEVLWNFFNDASSFSETIQCDFDPHLIGGKAAALLRTYGTLVRATPPHQQDKNGLVERRWQSLTKMARSFLTEAKLHKKFWFWAIREANICLNIFPITQQQDGTTDPALMSTPYFDFFVLSTVIGFYFLLVALVFSVVPDIVTTLAIISNHNVYWVLLSVEVNILTVWSFVIPILSVFPFWPII